MSEGTALAAAAPRVPEFEAFDKIARLSRMCFEKDDEPKGNATEGRP